VRSTAMLTLIKADLEQRDQAAALAKLHVLAGHDHRFTQSVALMEHALKSGAGRTDAMSALEAVLESEDHSAKLSRSRYSPPSATPSTSIVNQLPRSRGSRDLTVVCCPSGFSQAGRLTG
jgi:hypothetical protein